MKRMIFMLLLILGMGLWQNMQAQIININLTLNSDRQPAWGPAGFDYAPYYYIPAINVYYEVNSARFYYQNGSVWIYSTTLPPAYRNRDLHTLYKVVLKEPTPWIYNKNHKTAYKKYKKNSTQLTLQKAHHNQYRTQNRNNPSGTSRSTSAIHAESKVRKNSTVSSNRKQNTTISSSSKRTSKK